MVGRYVSALALLTAAAAASADPTAPLYQWARAALDRLPVAKDDRTTERLAQRTQNLDAFAAEIARVSASAPLPSKQWASLLVAIGGAESHFDTEVTAGRCKPLACDKGRARSAFQVHRLRFVEAEWDAAPGNIPVQVALADKVLRRTWGTCRRRGVPMPQAAFRGFAGTSCSWPMRGESLRVGYYNRAMGTP